MWPSWITELYNEHTASEGWFYEKSVETSESPTGHRLA